MTNYCQELVDEFEDLAEELKPPKKFLKAGKAATNKIFQLLKTEAHRAGLRIARTTVAGSIGKGTAIWDNDEDERDLPDFDLVIYINDEKPPFEDVLESLADIVEEHPSVSSINTTNRTVQFLFDDAQYGAIKFDLLPATNYVKHVESGDNVGELQAQLALEDLTQEYNRFIRNGEGIDIGLNKYYSSAFNEHTVEFIGGYVDDQFISQVVLLAKFWNFNLEMDNFPARSCIIELIAIHAQRKKGSGRDCIISGFKRFLELMANFGSLHVEFGNKIKNKNKPGPARQLALASTSKPMIIDPTNYFNNLADGIKSEAIAIFEDQAQKSLKVLEKARKRAGFRRMNDPIDRIFWHK